ncbi:MAG: trypsin-like peptidase domain-containing protein [Gammaproteobacteria bacterium]
MWDDNGHIATNYHVVQGANAATVTLSDHSAYPATLAGASPDYDLAVLRINAPAFKLKPLAVGEGCYVRPQLGIDSDDGLSREITRQLGVQGLVILQVQPGSPAAQAGRGCAARRKPPTVR